MVKQGVLAGRTAGLRPSQKRRLERLCHRRHPDDQVAELLCLQRLAGESRELELPLTLVVDGRGLRVRGHEQGFFTGGTLFDHVTADMSLWREEIFGPVLACVRVPSLDDALALIKAHAVNRTIAAAEQVFVLYE